MEPADMSATLRVRCTLLLFVLCCLQPSSPWLFQAAPPPTRLLRLLPFPSRPFPGRGIGSGMFSAGGGPARAFLAGSLQPMVTDRLTPLASTAPAAIAGGVKGAIGTSRRALRVADVLTSSAVFIYRWVGEPCIRCTLPSYSCCLIEHAVYCTAKGQCIVGS